MYPVKSTHLQSLLWLLLSILSSCCNDVFTKHLTTGLTFYQVCFCRFIFGSLILVPIIYYRGVCSFKTKHISIHFFRGLLLSIAMMLYAYSLIQLEISTVTIIGFTNPIFTLILSKLCLKETIDWPVWISTFLTFLGISFLFIPDSSGSYHPSVLVCLCATFIFSLLDIINKKYIAREPMLPMLLFSNLSAAFCTFPIAYFYWITPTLPQLMMLTILGIGSNLILYFILRAFELSNISSLAPIKYTEFVFSILFGYIFFKEWPTYNTFIGSTIIILCSYLIVYYQGR